jgi:hypothetical protein
MAQSATDALDAQSLLTCHRVFWVAAGVETADVADADAVFVVTSDVCASSCDWSSALYCAIEPNDVVVTNV